MASYIPEHPETGRTADEIWKLEQAGLAGQDEVHWRKRQDVVTDTERPAPPKAPWAPLTAEEFLEMVGREAFKSASFSMDSYGFYQAYNDYLEGFYQEIGKQVGLRAYERS